MVDKLDLPFPLLSDPRGELIKRLGLWNDEEGVSEPAIVALDKSGTTQQTPARQRVNKGESLRPVLGNSKRL
jgi:peroxiredoxin